MFIYSLKAKTKSISEKQMSIQRRQCSCCCINPLTKVIVVLIKHDWHYLTELEMLFDPMLLNATLLRCESQVFIPHLLLERPIGFEGEPRLGWLQTEHTLFETQMTIAIEATID